MRTVVKKWNNYYLTPFGKITIIKTNILSQCIHLLTVIPRSVEFLKEVNSIIYNFLWSGKPDKINRATTMLQCSQGGMNMINIFNFEKAIKVSWIKKIIFQTNSQWYKLLFCMHSEFNKILQFGDDWCTKLLGKVQNQFWQNVLNDWATMIRKCHYRYEEPHLTLKEGFKVKSETSKRFGAHDFLQVVFASKTSTTNNKGDIRSFNFGHLRFSNSLP